MAGILLLALLLVLSLVWGWDPRVGLRPQGLLGVVWLRQALWGFGGVRVCVRLLVLGVSWALWMAVVAVVSL